MSVLIEPMESRQLFSAALAHALPTTHQSQRNAFHVNHQPQQHQTAKRAGWAVNQTIKRLKMAPA